MIVLKILAAPFVVVLTVLAAVVSFLFCMATAVFAVACVVLTLLAVALFISGKTLGGIVFLVLAFLISPYGIPAIAEWLVDKLHISVQRTGCFAPAVCQFGSNGLNHIPSKQRPERPCPQQRSCCRQAKDKASNGILCRF